MSAKTSSEKPSEADASSGDTSSADSEDKEPIRSGRRLGDDPFLADEGFFWWLPRTFSLLVVAVALMLLGAHFFGSEAERPPAQQAVAQGEQEVPSPPPPPPAAPAAEPAVRGHALPVIQAPPLGTPNQLERGRSYNARRRLVLQEAEVLLRSLPAEGTGTPESDRDRRALRDFVQRMDTPAR